jgi:formylglycine-generating enzyme required for sulfatase activity
MVSIPAGSFEMGTNAGRPVQGPAHGVTLPAFELDRTEVTIAAMRGCVDAGACQPPVAYDAQPGSPRHACNWQHPEGRANHPVNCVHWRQASAFCAWAGKRLPTEEEWEYAATRGARPYPWGSQQPDATRLNVCGPDCAERRGRDAVAAPLPWATDGWVETAPVGSFPDGASLDGVQDLLGNVMEWTSSGFSRDYNSGRERSDKVVRGAGWSTASPESLSPKWRSEDAFLEVYHSATVGFRCARSAR